MRHCRGKYVFLPTMYGHSGPGTVGKNGNLVMRCEAV
jgi:hypothetical protein